jgi:methylglyoxal synthase
MKKSMMVFVASHLDFFRTVSIVTTGSTGGALEKKLGLTIARKVRACKIIQSARATCGSDMQISTNHPLRVRGGCVGLLSWRWQVASGPLGGDQEIGGMITNDEVACVFFFIDPLSAHPHEVGAGPPLLPAPPATPHSSLHRTM